MTDEHQTLLRLATRGDDDAVQSLLIRHLPGLRAYIRLRCSRELRARESCSDLAQSVCREALAALDGFEYRSEPEFRAWLFDKAWTKIVARMRYWAAQKRDAGRDVHLGGTHESAEALSQVYATIVTPSRVAAGREHLELLEEAFSQLPEDQREVVLLARVVGLSRTEIAKRLERSVDSVRGLLGRGMARVSWILSRHDPDEDNPT